MLLPQVSVKLFDCLERLGAVIEAEIFARNPRKSVVTVQANITGRCEPVVATKASGDTV